MTAHAVERRLVDLFRSPYFRDPIQDLIVYRRIVARQDDESFVPAELAEEFWEEEVLSWLAPAAEETSRQAVLMREILAGLDTSIIIADLTDLFAERLLIEGTP